MSTRSTHTDLDSRHHQQEGFWGSIMSGLMSKQSFTTMKEYKCYNTVYIAIGIWGHQIIVLKTLWGQQWCKVLYLSCDELRMVILWWRMVSLHNYSYFESLIWADIQQTIISLLCCLTGRSLSFQWLGKAMHYNLFLFRGWHSAN